MKDWERNHLIVVWYWNDGYMAQRNVMNRLFLFIIKRHYLSINPFEKVAWIFLLWFGTFKKLSTVVVILLCHFKLLCRLPTLTVSSTLMINVISVVVVVVVIVPFKIICCRLCINPFKETTRIAMLSTDTATGIELTPF
jgi:hypothetical protein